MLSLQRGDPAFGAGAPLHQLDEVIGLLDALAGLACLALADRASVTVAERHPPGLRRRHLTGETLSGLGDDLGQRVEEMFEIREHPTETLHRSVGDTTSVDQDPFGLLNSGFCQIDQFAGDGEHFGLGLLGPASQLGADPMGGLACEGGGVIEGGAWRDTGGLDPGDQPGGLRDPRINNPESVGYLMSAGTTVVSARNHPLSTTPASTALAMSVAFSSSISSGPQRVVIFINVDGCGADPPIGIRANRSHDNESLTSAHKVS